MLELIHLRRQSNEKLFQIPRGILTHESLVLELNPPKKNSLYLYWQEIGKSVNKNDDYVIMEIGK